MASDTGLSPASIPLSQQSGSLVVAYHTLQSSPLCPNATELLTTLVYWMLRCVFLPNIITPGFGGDG